MMESVPIAALVLVVSTGAIWFFSDKLERSARALGYYLQMPASVKGAVLYAVPSSFPELCIAILAVATVDPPVYSVGVGTIAGSAVFNLLIIPALSVLLAGKAAGGQRTEAIEVSGHVLRRDGLYYLAVVCIFITVALTDSMNHLIAGLFILAYIAYVFILYLDTRKHKARKDGSAEEAPPNMTLAKAVTVLLVSIAIVGGFCYLMVEATIVIAERLAIHPYVVAVIITAAATSVPDTVISVIAARQGGAGSEESIVNAFSSNIFDILICLSIPVFIASEVGLDAGEAAVSLVLLAVLTVVVLIMMAVKSRVSRRKGWVLLTLYVVFVLSAIFNNRILAALGYS